MTALDNKLPPLALKLLNKFGKSILLSVATGSSYNTSTRQNTVTYTSQTVKALVEEFADNLRSIGQNVQKDSMIATRDRKITIPAKGLTNIPKIKDTVIIDSITYTIDQIGSVYSGELVAYYVLRCKKY